MVGAAGLRFVAGDFNGGPDEYPILRTWESLGWREAQDLHCHLRGGPPLPICKGVSHPDRIYISPELARYFSHTEVRPLFSEYDVLTALDFPFIPIRQLWWPQPGALPWQDISLQSWDHSPAVSPPSLDYTTDLTTFYAQFGQNYEESVTGHLASGTTSSLPPHCRGRGQRTAPCSRASQMPVLKPSRPGEELPGTDFINRQLQRWFTQFTQLRRLQALLRNLRRDSQTPEAIDYRLSAKGFDGTFTSWRASRPILAFRGCLT